MALQAVSLDDKYALERGRLYLTGTQALVRLPMMQRQRDLAAGLNTAAYVTGYRGSPLGAVDQQMARARQFLDTHHIRFVPAPVPTVCHRHEQGIGGSPTISDHNVPVGHEVP